MCGPRAGPLPSERSLARLLARRSAAEVLPQRAPSPEPPAPAPAEEVQPQGQGWVSEPGRGGSGPSRGQLGAGVVRALAGPGWEGAGLGESISTLSFLDLLLRRLVQPVQPLPPPPQGG